MLNFYKEVIEVITEIVGDVTIHPEDYDKTLKDLGVDSLDTANILLELEERHGIEFLEEDIENLKTVNSIVSYMEMNQKK